MKDSPTLIIVFHSLGIGGVESKIIDICQALSPDFNIILALKEPVGLFLKRLPPSVTILHPPRFPNRLLSLFFPFWLANVFHHHHPQLVLSFNNYCAISSVVAKFLSHHQCHVIVSEDSSIIEQIQSDTFPTIRKKLVQITYPYANQIITLTAIGRKKLIELNPHLKTKISLCPNWLPISFQHQPQPTLKPIDVLFIGRFDSAKNPLEFIHISHHLIVSFPDIRIVMVGDGPMKSQIKKLVNSYHFSKKNFSLVPATKHSYRYFQKSKIFVLPSLREGFPLTILEATASHCLPICRNLPEIRSFFQDHPYLLFSNRQQAAKQIKFFLRHPQNAAKILPDFYQKSVNCQAKNFDITTKLIRRYLSV